MQYRTTKYIWTFIGTTYQNITQCDLSENTTFTEYQYFYIVYLRLQISPESLNNWRYNISTMPMKFYLYRTITTLCIILMKY